MDVASRFNVLLYDSISLPPVVRLFTGHFPRSNRSDSTHSVVRHTANDVPWTYKSEG